MCSRIGYVVALYARRFAGAGAVYEYLTHGAHLWIGVLTAGIFFLGTLFLGGGGIYLGVGNLAEGFWNTHISDNGPAWWVWGLIALAIVLALNYIGVRIAVGAMLTFAAVSFVPMLILAIVIVAKGGADGISLSVFDPGETGLLDLTGGGARRGAPRDPPSSASRPPPRSARSRATRTARSRAPCSSRSRRGRVLRRDVVRLLDGLRQGGRRAGPGRRPGGGQHDGDRVHRLVVRDHPRLVVILDAMALALAICVTIGRGFFAPDATASSRPSSRGRRGSARRGRQPRRRDRRDRPDAALVARRLRVAPLSRARRLGQPRPDPPRRVRDVHPLGDDRLARGRARLPDPRSRRSGSCGRRATSGGST